MTGIDILFFKIMLNNRWIRCMRDKNFFRIEPFAEIDQLKKIQVVGKGDQLIDR